MNRSVHSGADRSSVPVGPLVGFAAFLALTAVAIHLPIAPLAVLGAVVVSAVIPFIVVSVRRDRRYNDALTADYESWLASANQSGGQMGDQRDEQADVR